LVKIWDRIKCVRKCVSLQEVLFIY